MNSVYPTPTIPMNTTCSPLSPYRTTNIPCSKVMDCVNYLLGSLEPAPTEQIKEGLAELMKCENKLCVATQNVLAVMPYTNWEYESPQEDTNQPLTEQCIIATGTGLFCNKDLVTADSAADQITMNIRNTITDNIIIESIAVGTLCTDSAIDTSIAADTAVNVLIDCAGLTAGTIDAALSIQYKVVSSDGGGNFTKTASGLIVKTVA
jgi:hypothetical protein